ncbi:hypothetical protein C8Q80DRAFT_1273020 [Daedaleopsis nitida]|nr:hypothetical protein C8Q80DRAFT_1273020 [Daedaleopsis nitida]
MPPSNPSFSSLATTIPVAASVVHRHIITHGISRPCLQNHYDAFVYSTHNYSSFIIRAGTNSAVDVSSSSPSPRSSVSGDDRSDIHSDDSASQFFGGGRDRDHAHYDAFIAPLASSLSALNIQSRPTTPYPPTTPCPASQGSRLNNLAEESEDTAEAPVSATSIATDRQGRRDKVSLERRTAVVEDELVSVRAAFSASVNASRDLLLKTQRIIHEERRCMEKNQIDLVGTMEAHEQTLAKAHRAIASLQTKHNATSLIIDQMGKNIAEVIAIQEEMRLRLQQLEGLEQEIRVDAMTTRELVSELARCDSSRPSSVAGLRVPSLADELSLSLSDITPSHTAPTPEPEPQPQSLAGELSCIHPRLTPATPEVPDHALAEELRCVAPAITTRLRATVMWAGSQSIRDGVYGVMHFIVAAYLRVGPRIMLCAIGLAVLVTIGAIWLAHPRSDTLSSPVHSEHPLWDTL